jgi:hypothetical protein
MASTTQDMLLKTFLTIAGNGGELAGFFGDFVAQNNATSKTPAAAQETGSALESIVQTVFKSGLGLVPLVGGLLGLFGGGDDPPPTPLVKYAMPPRIAFNAAETSAGGIGNLDYGQSGNPRGYSETTATPTASTDSAGNMAPERPAPQITVNVQAMDARSFLDRSGDIAAAVREAMLNLNSINDVVNEL